MTVVRFPTRLRVTVVDGESADEIAACALDAADAALTRAVQRAAALSLVRAAQPDPGGPPRIDVAFSGDALAPETQRILRDGLIGLAQARAAALLARPAAVSTATPRQLGPNESATESFDAARLLVDRHNEVDDTYLVPSYNGRGSNRAVPVRGAARGTPPHPPPVHLQLWNFTTMAELEARLGDHFRGQVPELVVVVLRERGHPRGVLVRAEPNGRVLQSRYLGTWSMFEPPANEGLARAHDLYFMQADSFTFHADGGTRDDRREVREAYLREVLRADPSNQRMNDTQIANLAAARVRQIPDDNRPVEFFKLMYGSSVLALVAIDSMLAHVAFPVAVLTVQAPGRAEHGESDGSGEEGGADYDPGLPLEQLLFFTPDPAHAFLGEPPVEYWPATIAAHLMELIADLGQRLDMAPGRFPGMFALAAAERIKHLAESQGHLIGTGESEATPRSAALAGLAGAFIPLEELQTYYTRVIAGAGRAVPRPVRGNTSSWLLHFYEEYFPRRDAAVGSMFVGACQDILLSVLEASRREILRRQQNFPAYMRITRALILLLLVDDAELSRLRDILLAGPQPTVVPGAGGGGEIAAWYASTRLVMTAVGQVDVSTDGPPVRGRLRRTEDGTYQVQDSTGRWWTRAELDSVISTGRRQAFAVDPLLEKLADLPDTVERLRAAGAAGIDQEFRALLDELRRENESRTADVRRNVDIAFGLASFREADITSDESIGAELSGIHSRAHAFLRPLFRGQLAEVYTSGMRSLVAGELGKESFLSFFNIVGIAVIAVFCPPLALGIGVVQAAVAVDTALEHRGIQRAMLGGDEIITKAQAEAELWGAAIGAVLTIVPEAPGLIRGAVRGGGALLRGEAREAAAAAGRSLARRAAAHVMELAAQNLIRSFVVEALKGYVLNLALNAAIGRLTEAVAREVDVRGHASVVDLGQLISDAISGPQELPR